MPKQDAKLKAAREDRAYTLWLQRASIEDIMQDLGVKKAMAYRLRQRAELRAAENLKELEGQAGVRHQFAILTHAQREALQAWERSKTKKTTQKTGSKKFLYNDPRDGDGEGRVKVGNAGEVKKETTETNLLGDPRFLDLALKSTEQIRELLNLDPIEVRRILVSGDIDKKTAADLMGLSNEELQEKIAASLAGA